MKVRKVELGGRILSQFYEILILLSIPLNFFFSFIDTIHAWTFTNPPMVVAYNNEDNNLDHLDYITDVQNALHQLHTLHYRTRTLTEMRTTWKSLSLLLQVKCFTNTTTKEAVASCASTAKSARERRICQWSPKSLTHSPMGKNLHAHAPASLLFLSRRNTGEQVSILSRFMTAPKRAVILDYRGTSKDTQQQLLGICWGTM